ncbi:hypothetical protein CAJAP_06632 [Camponotus japonicus]
MPLGLLTHREEREGNRPLHVITFFALAGIVARRRASIATRNAVPKLHLVLRRASCIALGYTTTFIRIVMGTLADLVKVLRAETRVTLVISSLSLAKSGPSDPSNRRLETVRSSY